MKMIKNKMSPAWLAVAASLAIATCANAQDDEKPTLILKAEQPTAVDLSVESDNTKKMPMGAGIQRLVDLATANLAANTGVDAADIEVLEAGFVTWRDSSLGCPQPDRQYMQVITNGSRIVLQTNGTSYSFHSGGNTPPTYCPKPAKNKPSPYDPGEA
jgi:hypothetical protein